MRMSTRASTNGNKILKIGERTVCASAPLDQLPLCACALPVITKINSIAIWCGKPLVPNRCAHGGNNGSEVLASSDLQCWFHHRVCIGFFFVSEFSFSLISAVYACVRCCSLLHWLHVSFDHGLSHHCMKTFYVGSLTSR